MPRKLIPTLLFIGMALSAQGNATIMEVFAKGSVSKNYIASDKFTISVSGATGIAFTIIPRVRIEGRYTNISSLQNKLELATSETPVVLTDIKTQTTIYSLGIDIDILGDQATFQPFVYVGCGYINTERSYYYQVGSGGAARYEQEPLQRGMTGNVGAGFKVRFARSIAFEAEAFAYGIDIHKPNPLVNLMGSVGIRIYI